MSTSEQMIEALRNGDEAAFSALIEQYHSALLHTAMMYVDNRAVAEEVVQDVWVGVLKGIHRFQHRSSLKTWIFSILINRAKTRALREKRYEPLFPEDTSEFEPAVDAGHFHHPGGHWISLPESWNEIPEERLLSREVLDHIRRVIDALPAQQREVITLRDIQGIEASDVCSLLEITEANQRVLLHRARSRVRRALEAYLSERL
jgi:RNA polymerase sigma-70 factor, ECF subfamily